jgi:hypothetical protein
MALSMAFCRMMSAAVAAHIGFGGPHDGDVAIVLEVFLQPLELGKFYRFGRKLVRLRLGQ